MTDPADRERVIDTVLRFGSALDDRDWDVLHHCLMPELDVDYSSFRGTPPGRLSADEFVSLRKSGLAGLVTQHLSVGHRVEIHDDAASCRCDFVIRRWPEAPADSRFLHSYGYYQYVLRRAPHGWRISAITQVVRRSEGDRSLHGAFRSGPSSV